MGSGCNPCRKARKLPKGNNVENPQIKVSQGDTKSKQTISQSKDFFKKTEQTPTLNSNIMHNLPTKDEKPNLIKDPGDNLRKSHEMYGSKKEIPTHKEKNIRMTSRFKEEDNSMKRCKLLIIFPNSRRNM